ncbi:MAPEG family protein [Ensifer adhaerens]|uniref:MAPEG family protein n=1 Tax=Ensifer adhaerens TaxID=106592 RepID=UPI001CBE42E4|nr:MAPEG family protein [Ensifer adhaerens]MBZ7923526.1 MAPEG family protein [Ensifer adhaerens]UAX92088.1 MAPEG family protein [Ensifer adhaerens]UAX99720.1 MAPEG family protein [Ensifer adhaerens]UAY07104.1 MAPEG family protein [Ensifer adhaerens]
MEAAAASTEIWVLGWSVVLLVAHILVQALSLDLAGDLGVKYLLGPRDEQRVSKSIVAGRLLRSLRNMLETYPAFVALALALAVTGKTGGLGAVGAVTWILARVVYTGLYVAGIPVLRSIVWFVSIIALLLMVARLMA